MLETPQGSSWLDDVVGEIAAAAQPESPAAPPAPETPAPAHAAGEPAAPAAGSAAPAVTQDPGSPPSPELAAKAPPEAAAVPAAGPPEEPFVFRGGVSVPGAVKMADGSLRVPPDRVQTLERTLQSERALQRQTVDLRRQLTEANEGKTAKDAQADALANAFAAIIDATKKNPEDGVRQFLDLASGFDRFRAEALAEHYKRQAETVQQQHGSVLEAQQWAAVQDEFWGNVEGAIGELTKQGEYAALKGKEAELVAELKRDGQAVFRDQSDGLFKYDSQTFARVLRQAVAVEQRVARERQQWEQRNGVQQRNQATLAPTNAPVVPSAATPPIAPPSPKAGKLSKDEWRKSIDDDDAFAESLR